MLYNDMDGTSESLVMRIVQSVATYTTTDPLELPPLYYAIDPDILAADIRRMNDGKIQFRYAGHIVTVYSDGTVEVTDDPVAPSPQTQPATDD